MDFVFHRYEVLPGDTVASISLQSGIPVDKLRKWNRLFGNEVYASQIISLKDPNAPSKHASTTAIAPPPVESDQQSISFLDDEPVTESQPLPPKGAGTVRPTLSAAVSRTVDMEALGEWVTVMSTSAADRVCSGMGKLTGIVRGPSPPLPHDVSVLSDLIIDPATDSVTDTVAEDVAVAVTEHLTIPKRMTVSTRKLEGVGVVLTEARSELLREVLPIYMQDETLVLLYSILSHGSDMASFFSQSKGYPYSVIIIQACSGEIFGGFAAGMWKQANKYYGDGESFVFHFVDGETSVTPYRWNRSNDFFLWSDSSSVAMGGGGNGFAFMVSDDFHNGITNRSGTFDNCSFVASNTFRVESVEVWGFKKYFDSKLVLGIKRGR